ncbi:hypothetical protein H1V43_10115 [Streptomyces sp. PSKA54]|uniref:Uncharacterized protein n=1 Tax=Streptomyces himalayensis subsp. aureolus TaxID=2758039 RepID=A0A7W2HFJ4_9ACTN|nr:hypothetical protein [Streptomyces himalayensis]MBA4861734.1 hypothetical protein [Streptomyces himalayensis subsp. aureolus]
MFEIRIICDPHEADSITHTLAEAFTTGPVRQHATRDGKRTRLYVTADHRPKPEPWPTPDEAYALAPSIIREIGWTARAAAEKPFGTRLPRDFWLRKAAVLDRIALKDEADGFTGDAADVATVAAQRLMDLDDVGVICDPRHYVRQQYAQWAKNQ